MIEGIPRISILIITYKQEKLIKRAIESILLQKDFIYEICVSDDCSPDHTWKVLQEYAELYSGLFKLHRNETNVGIFENIELSWAMPTGDIIYQLAGDDECGENWFEKVIEFIDNNKIDYKNELFVIYGDYKCVSPNGDAIVKKNSAVKSGINPFRLGFRKCLNNRSACYSIGILKKFNKVSRGKSHIAENIQDRLLQIYSKKSYYIPMVGNIYYSRIGISVHMTDEIKREREKIWPYTLGCLSDMGIKLSWSDVRYAKYRSDYQKVLYSRSPKAFLSMVMNYMLSFDIRFIVYRGIFRYFKFTIKRILLY